MADDKPASGSGTAAGKRPHAVLDLKATEIKVTPISSKNTSRDSTPPGATEVPRPAPARSYGSPNEAKDPKSEPAMQSETAKAQKTENVVPPKASATGRAPGDDKAPARTGGFFSHVAAGVAGGAIVLAAMHWGLPQFGSDGDAPPRVSDESAALSARVATLEDRDKQRPAGIANVGNLEARVTDLEKTAQKIPALTESQSRLVAETKAALASAASDAGAPQLIERLGKVEDKLKALADAGANDPGSGRIAQLAALTGKVSDLETSLATQLNALRASVSKDVEGRIQSATEASEAARAGTQRIDKDVAGLKSDDVRLEERIGSVKDATDHLAAELKVAEDQTASLKGSFETLKSTTAKPTDIAAAIAPLNDRTAAVEKSVADIVKEDAARRESTQRVVLALELQNLRRVMESGQAFAAELAEMKKVSGSQLDISALARLADRGVPTLAELNKEFRAAADKAMDAESEPENAGVVDRLWAGAKSIVRVRRIDLKPDDKSTEASLGRMQVALNDGQLSDVLEASKDLSGKSLDAMRLFLDKVAARVSVDRGLAALETNLKTSIAPGASEPAKTVQ